MSIILPFLPLLPGSLPNDVVAAFTNLTTLGIADNLLTGSIPEALASLSYLATVDFTKNQLVGTVPPSLCNGAANYSSITDLLVSNNKLSGVYNLGFCDSMINLDISVSATFC